MAPLKKRNKKLTNLRFNILWATNFFFAFRLRSCLLSPVFARRFRRIINLSELRTKSALTSSNMSSQTVKLMELMTEQGNSERR